LTAELLAVGFWLWIAGALAGLVHGTRRVARLLLAAGCVTVIVACVHTLPAPMSPVEIAFGLGIERVRFALQPGALWLLGFGLVPTVLACGLGSPLTAKPTVWFVGVAFSLIGALGVFGLQDGIALLIAWELMSLGGALMVVSEQRREVEGKPVLLMLGLLEVGAVALLLGILLIDHFSGMSLGRLSVISAGMPSAVCLLVGLCLLVGFGAKLGLVPFYEWFPRAYGNASGATGVIFSTVVLNAAFSALERGWNSWLPLTAHPDALFALGVIGVAVGVVSAILAILFAFQQDDWRTLLSYSSAENASIAVTMLGVSAMFHGRGLDDLAGLAWTVALLHLAGHALAKGALFLVADGIYASVGSYDLVQRGWMRTSGVLFGVGAVFSAMSLCAIPPQAGFVSEWYVFQTVFQGFHLPSFAGRLVLVLAGAGLALAAAVSLATFVKLLGLGLLGTPDDVAPRPLSRRIAMSVGLLGAGVLALAVGAPLWLGALAQGAVGIFQASSPHEMVSGWLLVPLTDKFAFISPSKLIIVMPLLALIPLALLVISVRRPARRASAWYGGMTADRRSAMTTPLTFSNAMRTFYSFIYQPTMSTEREHQSREYFIKRLVFSNDVTDIFDRHLFIPMTRLVEWCARRLRALQSGNLNFYLALIGALLVAILALTLI